MMKPISHYLKDLKPGDEVVVRYRVGSRSKQGDSNEPAVVVSRKRVNVEVQSRKTARHWNLRLDNGQEQRDSQPRGWLLLTPEYLADEKRERDTREFLQRKGIRVERDSPWYGREHQLAMALKAYAEADHWDAALPDANERALQRGLGQ